MQELKQPSKKPLIFYYVVIVLVIMLLNATLFSHDVGDSGAGGGLHHLHVHDL